MHNAFLLDYTFFWSLESPFRILEFLFCTTSIIRVLLDPSLGLGFVKLFCITVILMILISECELLFQFWFYGYDL